MLEADIARDTLLMESEGCAEGLGVEERTPSTAHGSASSSADSCEMGDGAPVNTIDDEQAAGE
jgi:hypothetical protein